MTAVYRARLEQAKKLIKKAGFNPKLDIGCGARVQDGFIGVDIQPEFGKDSRVIQWDLETYPWPFPNEAFQIAVASHVAEHISRERGGFLKWMDEIWRVMRPDGQLMISAPYGMNALYHQDPTHVNPLTENTWRYFDPLDESGFYEFYRPKPWRIVNCFFDVQGFIEVLLEKRREDRSYAK